MYIGGHGATKLEKQMYLLNSSDPKKVTYQIEYKLRNLIRDDDSFTRIVAVFDCCRANLANYEGLEKAYAGKGKGGAESSLEEQEEEQICKYIKI